MTSTFNETEAVITSHGTYNLDLSMRFIIGLRGTPAGYQFVEAGVRIHRQLPNGPDNVVPFLGQGSIDAFASDLINWMKALDDEYFARSDRPRDPGSDSWWHKDGFTIVVEPHWKSELWATITPKWHLIGK